MRICSQGRRDTYRDVAPAEYIEQTIAEFCTPERIASEIGERDESWGGYVVAELGGRLLVAGAGGMIEPKAGELCVLYADPRERRRGGGTASWSSLLVSRGARRRRTVAVGRTRQRAGAGVLPSTGALSSAAAVPPIVGMGNPSGYVGQSSCAGSPRRCGVSSLSLLSAGARTIARSSLSTETSANRGTLRSTNGSSRPARESKQRAAERLRFRGNVFCCGSIKASAIRLRIEPSSRACNWTQSSGVEEQQSCRGPEELSNGRLVHVA